ncbi:MAG: cytochrome c oxidase subunit 3 [Pirellulales bacterium]
MRRTQAIDVSELPGIAFDTQAPMWWGNMLMMLIETMTVALFVTSYFYLSQNFTHWPPPNSGSIPPLHTPLPDLGYGSCVVALLALATIPMVWADRAAHDMRPVPVVVGLSLGTAAGIAAIILRVFEFQSLHVRWDDNAYGSLVWGLLSLHLLYIILEVGEAAINVVWILLHGMDEKHAVDATLSTEYWYWTVAVALLIYGVIYWAPRLMS